MKIRLDSISILVLLYSVSLFPLTQPWILSTFGEGSTSVFIIFPLLILIVFYVLRSFYIKYFKINRRYLIAYFAAIFAIVINYIFHINDITYPEKYFAAVLFIGISGVISCMRFHHDIRLPGWVSVILALLFFYITLRQALMTGFNFSVRSSLNEEVVSNLNYIPIAAFIMYLHFFATKQRLPIILSGLTVAALLLLTQSRSAMLGVIAALVFIVIKNEEHQRLTKFVRVLMLLAAVETFSVYSGIHDRITQAVTIDQYESVGRVLIFEDLLERFRSNPIIGAGLAVDKDIRYDAHNLFFEMLLQGGIVSFLLVMPIFLVAWKAIGAIFKQSSLGLMVSTGLVCLLISGNFTGSLLLNFPFWIMLGFAVSIYKHETCPIYCNTRLREDSCH